MCRSGSAGYRRTGTGEQRVDEKGVVRDQALANVVESSTRDVGYSIDSDEDMGREARCVCQALLHRRHFTRRTSTTGLQGAWLRAPVDRR